MTKLTKPFLFAAIFGSLLISAPSFSKVAPAPADNSKINQRDQNDSQLTASDQGDSDADIATTQKIRQAVVSRESLSINAKNIKIITLNGVVTLKGPVASLAEKREIQQIAAKVATPAKIVDQIQVAQ